MFIALYRESECDNYKATKEKDTLNQRKRLTNDRLLKYERKIAE